MGALSCYSDAHSDVAAAAAMLLEMKRQLRSCQRAFNFDEALRGQAFDEFTALEKQLEQTLRWVSKVEEGLHG